MVLWRVPVAILVALTMTLVLIVSVDCQQPTYNYHMCSSPSNDTGFTSSLGSLLDSLPSRASQNSFYNDSSDGIYTLFLCRGDVPTNTCQSCINRASLEIRERCGSNRTAIIWYDKCMLRYSYLNFFGMLQTRPNVLMYNVQNNTTPEETNYGALGLIYSLITSAPNTDMMFETDDRIVRESVHGYALVQCTRDLNSSSCQLCLRMLAESIQRCCEGRVGWRIMSPSCNLRYEERQFYNSPLAPPPPVPAAQQPTPTEGGNGGNNTRKTVIIVTLTLAAAVAILVGLCYYFSFCRKRKAKEEGRSEEILLPYIEGSSSAELMEQGLHSSTDEHHGVEMHGFSLSTIQAATNNFSRDNKLGEGGFGPVYKGKLLNGKEIAVKRLSVRSSQGIQEFKNEVNLIIKLQHKNLVRLLGYCLEADEKLLVYEYMANTGLDTFLFDPTKSKELDWEKRVHIIKGIARGLLYLHEDSRLKIIHRDLKASNVLLDDEMNAKISDFGTARIFGSNQMEANTERIVGTYGYMAPEYGLEGLFSIKSDVYSFGVLMLEIISGKRNRGIYDLEHGQNLLLYGWRLWNEGNELKLVDPNILEACDTSEASRWIHIALLCVQDDPGDRPTMSEVVLMLGSKSMNLPQPSTMPYSVARFTTMSNQFEISENEIITGTGTSGFLSSDQTSTSNTS